MEGAYVGWFDGVWPVTYTEGGKGDRIILWQWKLVFF
jgi:hypothetical protein